MSVALVMTLREALEMLLIIVPLIVYLYKVDRSDLSKHIYFGSGTGVVASIVAAVVLFQQVNKMEGYPQQLFLGLTMIFLACLILYSIIWVSKNNKKFSLNITDKYDVKLTGTSLFLLAFVTVFRESLEIILFLLPLEIKEPMMIILGVIIGALCALVAAFIIFKTSIKLNVALIFSALTLILIILGGELLGEGLAIIFPNIEESISIFGQLIFTIPLLFLFLKRELRKYLKK